MQPMTALTSTARQAVDAANGRFEDLFNVGDVEGAARAVYTANARVLPPGADLVRGRDNIVEFWRNAAVALGITRVELSTVELEFREGGAQEIGEARLTVAGGEQQARAKYVVVWKEENGEWRWDIDIWNMNG